MSFEFRESDHSYWLSGHRIPSVTELLQPLSAECYAGIPTAVLDHARQRGKDVATATQLDDENDLDEASLYPELLGYVAAWRRFKTDTKAEVVLNERALYHPSMRFAGTPDRVVAIDGQNWLLDHKAVAEIQPIVHIQLAGYALLLEPAYKIHKRAALHLRPDGTYRLVETPAAEIHDHTAAFYGLLATHQWRVKYGRK